MKGLVFVAIIAAGALVWYVVSQKREGFAKEFVDRSNEERTDLSRVSSYKQTTNNFKPTKALYEPPAGTETPFRVNQYNSYIPA
jgi:cytoskeletal protein RodZ